MLWSLLCRKDIDGIEREIFSWLKSIKSGEDELMSKVDIIEAIKSSNVPLNTKCFNLKHFQSLAKMLMQNKSNVFSKHRIFRYLLELIKPNSEFDIILLNKVQYIHFEGHKM